jgi:hypothetical protein
LKHLSLRALPGELDILIVNTKRMHNLSTCFFLSIS